MRPRESTLFPMHRNTPNQLCPIGRSIQGALSRYFQEAQLALENDLERITVADLVRDVNSASR